VNQFSAFLCLTQLFLCVEKKKLQSHLCIVPKQAFSADRHYQIHEKRYHCAVITDKLRIDRALIAQCLLGRSRQEREGNFLTAHSFPHLMPTNKKVAGKEMTDIRWSQRFSNYKAALAQLTEALSQDRLNQLEQEGLIQRFEYTFELGWKTLKDYLEDKGFAEIVGSREAIKTAFANGIISNGQTWMEMITDRNLTSHLYDSGVTKQIVENVRFLYYPAFCELLNYLETKDNELRK